MDNGNMHTIEQRAIFALMERLKRAGERRAKIVAMREQRKTFKEIGDVFNLTRQRVHQIYKEAG